jgi:hypothetical protein
LPQRASTSATVVRLPGGNRPNPPVRVSGLVDFALELLEGVGRAEVVLDPLRSSGRRDGDVSGRQIHHHRLGPIAISNRAVSIAQLEEAHSFDGRDQGGNSRDRNAVGLSSLDPHESRAVVGDIALRIDGDAIDGALAVARGPFELDREVLGNRTRRRSRTELHRGNRNRRDSHEPP